MKGHAISLAFLTAIMLSSCSAENELASTGSGNEILFNVEEVPFKPDSASGDAATRATMRFETDYFYLYAIDEEGNWIVDGEEFDKDGDNWIEFSEGKKFYWPESGKVTFYAICPTPSYYCQFSTNSSNSTRELIYRARETESTQEDVLYAYASLSRPTDNTVRLTFNHANAAFSVNARLASGCLATVNVSGVQLVNVKSTNTVTFSNGNTIASGNNISPVLACSAKTLTTSNQAISTSPLMLPPQTVTAWNGTSALANTYLAVTCKVSQDDKYVVGSESTYGVVYVPMNKTLNKGENNNANLVFGTLDGDKRYYGRKSDGTRIYISNSSSIPESKDKNELTTSDIGKVICSDGTVYRTVSEARTAGKTPVGMIAYINIGDYYEEKFGMAIALSDLNDEKTNAASYGIDDESISNYNNTFPAYNISMNSPTLYDNEEMTDNAIDNASKGWNVPSSFAWENIIEGCGGSFESSTYYDSDAGDYHKIDTAPLRQKLRACGANDVKEDLYWSSTSGKITYGDDAHETLTHDICNFSNNHYVSQEYENHSVTAYTRLFFYFRIE